MATVVPFYNPFEFHLNFDNSMGTFLDNSMSEDLTILVAKGTMLEFNIFIYYL